MKWFALYSLVFFIFFTGMLQAQQAYTIDGKSYSLQTEVEGELTLLWNIIDDEYRYFVKRGNTVLELKNTKKDGDFQEEYKHILARQTADASIPTKSITLTLPSLRDYILEYNKKKNPNFNLEDKTIQLQFRLGVFAGMGNSIFSENPTNAFQPLAGLDLELVDAVKLKRHAMVMRVKHTFKSSDYKYSATQLSLNYRFKFIKTQKFDAFVNCKFASLDITNREEIVIGYTVADQPVYGEIESGFSAPVIFGLGADYKVGNGFITFNYNDIVGLSTTSNGEFPIDFTVGYKLSL